MSDNGLIDFTYRPKTDGKRILPTVLVIAALSAVLVVLSATLPYYRGVVSLIAVIGICVSLYLAMRYIMSDFVYTVYTGGSETPPLLLIYRRMGRRESLMCRVELAMLCEIKQVAKAQKNAHAPDPNAQKFNFCPNFSPDSYYVLIARGREVNMELSLEITPEVSERLLSYAEIARQMDAEDEF